MPSFLYLILPGSFRTSGDMLPALFDELLIFKIEIASGNWVAWSTEKQELESWLMLRCSRSVSLLTTTHFRADSKLAPRQWETSLLGNATSHWLGANLESARTGWSFNNEIYTVRHVYHLLSFVKPLFRMIEHKTSYAEQYPMWTPYYDYE